MYAQVLGSTTFGLNGHVIGVEVDINKNFPSFDIVGLPTTAVKESKNAYTLPSGTPAITSPSTK